MFEQLPDNASEAEMMTAEAATIQITNQNNGIGGACVHHCAINNEALVCPVKALVRRLLHIRRHTRNKNTLLNAYWDEVGQGAVTDANIRFAMKYSAAALRYDKRGIPIDRIDTHSCRSGGACAMKLAGYDDSAIRKQGRWAPNSNAFMEYIQQQLSTFTKGMAERMRAVDVFTNMEGGVTREDLRPSTIY